MTKTALELTQEEWQLYQPAVAIERRLKKQQAQIEKRWQQAHLLAKRAMRLLQQEYGAEKVVAFGSLAHKLWFTPWSDIDLAVWGIPPERFYAAVAKISSLSPVFKIDLVDPETCHPQLRVAIERDGIEL